MSNLTSGVFLVRFSAKSGDDVLTLLYDNQPKHFIIQKYVRSIMLEDFNFIKQKCIFAA